MYDEVCLVDLVAKYGNSEMGLQYIKDIQASQKGKPHPDPKARALFFFKLLIETFCPKFRKNESYRIYKIFRHNRTQSILPDNFLHPLVDPQVAKKGSQAQGWKLRARRTVQVEVMTS